MKKGAKIAIAAGATLAIAVIGIVIYRRMSNGSQVAREYLEDVDENGGAAPNPNPVKSESKNKIFIKKIKLRSVPELKTKLDVV